MWRGRQGLALSLFLFAVCGNVTYVASVLLYSTDKEYLLDQLPYLLGRYANLAGAWMGKTSRQR